MSAALEQILRDAANWLEEQGAVSTATDDERRAIVRFRAFLASISSTDAPPKLEVACGLIGHWIVDQMDWSTPCCSKISHFVEAVRRFAKDEAWRRQKSGMNREK